MALKHDRTGFGTKPFTRVLVGSSRIGPGDDRDPFDPRGDRWPVGHDRDMHWLVLVAQNRLGVLAPEDRTGARIDGPASVLFETVMDLTLVSIHVFAGNAAKEDPRIDVLSQRQRGRLEA